nr:MAG TPA: hypothetical protein [Caudoviricetes sp.]
MLNLLLFHCLLDWEQFICPSLLFRLYRFLNNFYKFFANFHIQLQTFRRQGIIA